jgi:hypothetical protein
MSAETPVQQPPRLGRGARWAITAGIAAVCWLGGLVLVVAALIAEVVSTEPGENPESRFGQPLFVAAGLVFAVGVAAIVAGTILGFRSPRARRAEPREEPSVDPRDETREEPHEEPAEEPRDEAPGEVHGESRGEDAG